MQSEPIYVIAPSHAAARNHAVAWALDDWRSVTMPAVLRGIGVGLFHVVAEHAVGRTVMEALYTNLALNGTSVAVFFTGHELD